VIDAELREFRDWIFRFRPATAAPSRLLVLLHGWTGDENSVWVFARKLPAQVAVLALRGPYVAPESGYTWREIRPETGGLPVMDDLRQSAEALIGFVDDWSHAAGVSANQIDLIGFSQGADLFFYAGIAPSRADPGAGSALWFHAGWCSGSTCEASPGRKTRFCYSREAG
jgi:predicted esterase